jgi:hypothetical protein
MEDWRVVVRQHGQKTASNEPNAVIQTMTNPTSTAGGQGGQIPPSTTSSQAASVPTISTNYVTFNENSIFTTENTFGGSDRIFVSDWIKTHAVDFTYSWEDSSFEPLNVSLIVVNQNNNNVDRANASTSSSSSLSLTSESIKFNYTKLTEGAEEGQSGVQASVDGFILALDMYWKSEGKSLIGHSYSPYFSILGNAQNFRASALQAQIAAYGTNKDGRDADVTTVASPSSSSSNTASDGHSNPSSGSGGGGGLSTGAIVGIAIGGAAGLAIIALVAWFLLRRRRSKSQIVDTHGASNAYIADKDSTAQSPQSPYADDVIHNPRADSSSLHNAHADNVPGPRDGSGTATPSGLSRNVAHLVEEGMTADDIARLEEEERQLDDEIERAASQAARR